MGQCSEAVGPRRRILSFPGRIGRPVRDVRAAAAGHRLERCRWRCVAVDSAAAIGQALSPRQAHRGRPPREPKETMMHPPRRSMLQAFAGGLIALRHSGRASAQAASPPDVPYVPTPPAVVFAMLRLARVGAGDTLYDLGSGDGRIPITAAKRFGARAIGFDIDRARIAEARRNAVREGVADKVRFVEGDLFEQDLSPASVITLYLLPRLNLRLRPRLLALKPGTRIVSHGFDMGDWAPERTVDVQDRPIYLWTVPRIERTG
jgi:SAM-dependent methyltransferase